MYNIICVCICIYIICVCIRGFTVKTNKTCKNGRFRWVGDHTHRWQVITVFASWNSAQREFHKWQGAIGEEGTDMCNLLND